MSSELSQMFDRIWHKKDQEYFSDGNVLYLNVSADTSVGADVLKVNNNSVVMVDGTGSGQEGHRKEAEELALRLQDSRKIIDEGTYIALNRNKDNLNVRARGSGLLVIFSPENNYVVPKVVWAKGDSNTGNNTPTLIRDFPIADVKHLLLCSDGGMELLGNKTIFGSMKGFDASSQQRIDQLVYEYPPIEDISKQISSSRFLDPLDYILNYQKDRNPIDVLKPSFEEYKNTLNDVSNSRPDDATLVFTSFT